MPMIMDDTSYVDKFDEMDDLFLDPQPPLNIVPILTNDVILRISDMCTYSCCRKIAWSRNGSIVRINGNGQSLTIQSLERNQETSEFTISKSSLLEYSSFLEHPNHVQWSEAGNELAISDISGRVIIFQTILTISNRMIPVGKFGPSLGMDQWNPVRGMIWLNVLHPTSRFSSHARKVGNRWMYPPSALPALGPVHPIPNKTGLMFVNCKSDLRLVFNAFPQTESFYEETNTFLDASECDVTHASFAAEQGGTMLLATVDETLVVKIYRIVVHWNYPFREREMPPRTFRLQPTLDVQRLKISRLPTYDENFTTQLFTLHMLSAVTDDITGVTSPISLMAGFIGVSMTQPFTRLIRLELHEEREELHSSWAQVATKNNVAVSSALMQTYGAVQQADTDLPGIVVECTTMRNNTIIILAKSDGSVIFLDRFTMQPISREADPSILRTMVDAGFGYTPAGVAANVSFSPSGYAFVTCNSDDPITIRYIDFPPEQSDHLEAQQSESLIPAALCLAFTTIPTGQQPSYDDILALVQHNSSRMNTKSFLEFLLSGMAINLTANANAADSTHRLLNSQTLPRFLAMQHLLGGCTGVTSPTTKLAWTVLNLRHTAWILHISLSTVQQETPVDLPASLLGIFQWLLDLEVELIAGLFWASKELKSRIQPDDTSTIQPSILKSFMSPSAHLALPLLLTNICRIFIRSNTRYIRSLATAASQRIHHGGLLNTNNNNSNNGTTTTTTAAQQHLLSWQAMVNLMVACPVSLRHFEALLAELDYYVKNTYDEAGWDEAARAHAETEMLITGNIPDVLTPVVQRLLTSALDKVLEGSEESPGRLIKLLATPKSGGFRKNPKELWEAVPIPPYNGLGDPPAGYDVVRKIPLSELKDHKRCLICGSVMENLLPRPGKIVMWLVQLQKYCVCGGNWALVSGGS